MSINEQWLINLSDTEIPEKAKVILQLGQQFNLLIMSSAKKRMLEFIKHECNLFKTDDEIYKTVRNEVIQIFKSIDNCDIKSRLRIIYHMRRCKGGKTIHLRES